MPGARDVRKSRQSVRMQYKAFIQCMPLDAPLRPNIFHGRKCQISRRFFGKNAGFHGILCCCLNPQHHLPALRPICVPNVTNGHFYRAMLCIRGTSHGPVSVSVSVCLSQVGVLLKRLNVGSQKQHHTIAQFSDAKDLREIRPGSPPTRAPNAGGVGQNR